MPRKVLSWVWAFAAFAVLAAGGYVLAEYVLGRPLKSVWYYLISGSILSVGTSFMAMATRRGWIRGVFRDPQRAEELRQRLARLAMERERAVSQAGHQ